VTSHSPAVVGCHLAPRGQSLGGNFEDLAGNRTHVPEFNRLIAFKVPRMHEVQYVRDVTE
jgi:Rps23 Pro-64 3,4-dihydroxylase Tpa1-like proline 4-hydroxylase